jgi:hypothetical protein
VKRKMQDLWERFNKFTLVNDEEYNENSTDDSTRWFEDVCEW